MEAVLEVYHRAPERSHPVVCMDETSVQCIKEVRPPIAAKPGQSERYDVEYERNGVAHLVLFYAPFENWRRIQVADNHIPQQIIANQEGEISQGNNPGLQNNFRPLR